MRINFHLLLLAVVLFTSQSFVLAHSSVEPTETIEATSCELESPLFITWSPAEVTCPVCGTKNIFMEVMSYGNYIYRYPSKYQLIFWPHTDSPTWYSCKQCRLTAFMGEFQELPKDKIPALREMLKSVKLPPQKQLSEKESLENPPYLGISVWERLTVAEQVYRTVGKPEEFWARFYRVMAYHFDRAKKEAEAADARKKSLKIVEGWLQDQSKAGQHKEFLYISGAMHHFLKDDAAATKSFQEALKLKYSNSANKPENNQGYDQYLNELINEYLEMLKKGAGPRTQLDKVARNDSN
jgi:hypothetical protein